jgi:hypothetical protein
MYVLAMMLQRKEAVEAYAWLQLATARRSAEAVKASRTLRPSLTPEQVAAAKTLAVELRASLRPSVRRSRKPLRGLKYYAGSQEMWGGMCEWRASYSVQSWSDGRWTLFVRGEEGRTRREGPIWPEHFPDSLEQYGLDLSDFLSDLRARDVPMMDVLAQQIEQSLRADTDAE